MGINHSPATHVLEYAPWGETINVAGILLPLLMYVLFRFRVLFRLLSATCFFCLPCSVRLGSAGPTYSFWASDPLPRLCREARRGEAVLSRFGKKEA